MTCAKNLVIALFAVLAVAGLPAAHAQSTEGVAALVNDEPITTVDVRNRMRLIIASTGMSQIDQETLARIQDQALRGLIDEHLQLQAAREYEIEVEDSEITNSLLDLANRNNTTIDAIISDLENSGVDIATLRHQLEAEIAWQILVNGRYGSRIRISDQQIELALERLAASASQPQYRIFEMYFEVPAPGQEQATVQRLIAVMNQLQQGAAFPELARQFSDAPSAASGGDIGWIVASQLQPEVAAIMPQMRRQFEQTGGQGALSNPVQVPGGFMVIALVGVRDGTTTLQYDLNQITVPASAIGENTRSRFARLMAEDPTCATAESVANRLEGAIHTPLGSIGADAVLAQIREALEPLDAGENTGVIENAGGSLTALIVCDRAIAGPGVPTRDQLEADLRGQQLSLQSRRWLRDLRRDSTIEIRD
ncbi:peptidylprolyl isomerase [Maricaulis sp.]|jgi:peptidyl-prolyl cis-trans isomerase SurA|uniref:peptidylprolyl isomerase n=1 Tax=Maricaulis sp. TaxID=1486257 RepID=UPI00260A633C|nr:peptidylprolyl isomerase [Maricaulis sp.]